MVIIDHAADLAPADQSIDYSVGLTEFAELSQKISKRDTLCIIHSKSQEDGDHVLAKVTSSFHLSSDAVELPPLVVEVSFTSELL